MLFKKSVQIDLIAVERYRYALYAPVGVFQQILCLIYAQTYYELLDGRSCMLFEKPANVLFGEVERACDIIQTDAVVQIIVNITYDMVNDLVAVVYRIVY